MRPFLPLLAALGCTQPSWPEAPPAEACAAGAVGPEERVMRVEVGNRNRQGLVWAPTTAGPHDVVVSLHELGTEPRRQAYYSGFRALAAERGMLLAGPDGRSTTWNAGHCCGRARMRDHPDVAFLDIVAGQLDAVGCTTGRVLATGIGNGGMMAHRWACESDVPDAVISVGGALQIPTCDNPRPIPVLHYHGALDTWMPADGSGNHMPVEHAIAQWKIRNQAVEVEPLVDGDLHCRRFEGAAPMLFCTVEGMRDLWPGAADAPVASGSPLADATRGGMDWVLQAWSSKPASEDGPPPAVDDAATPESPEG